MVIGMLIDLHTHTSSLSSCGSLTLAEEGVKGEAHVQNLCRCKPDPVRPEPFGKLRTGYA
jgi:hypothetical protein